MRLYLQHTTQNVLQVGNAAWKQFLKTVLDFTSNQLNILLIVAYVLLWLGIMAYKKVNSVQLFFVLIPYFHLRHLLQNNILSTNTLYFCHTAASLSLCFEPKVLHQVELEISLHFNNVIEWTLLGIAGIAD